MPGHVNHALDHHVVLVKHPGGGVHVAETLHQVLISGGWHDDMKHDDDDQYHQCGGNN